MKEYLRERQAREKTSTLTGILLTVLVHVGALCLVSFTGIKYLYPPPQEQSFLIDFEEDEPEKEEIMGKQPQGEDVDLTKAVELVQKSESPVESKAKNLTTATKPDTHGDVEVPEPPRKEEPKVDPRATFPGMAKKDTSLTAQHGAKKAGATYKEGQANGNTTAGKTEGSANAHVFGRKVNKSTLAKPAYNIQESGKVVVKIWVDQYGNVKKAEPGADGTTITNSKLWAASRSAALNTKFDQKADAPAMQEGTITYIFNLK